MHTPIGNHSRFWPMQRPMMLVIDAAAAAAAATAISALCSTVS